MELPLSTCPGPTRDLSRIAVLGIETSCDETAVAVVAGDRRVLAASVVSQLAEHAPFGGVVPEIAARSHILTLDRLIRKALEDSRTEFGGLAGIAVTVGPGLIGGLLVGLVTARAIAAVHGLTLIPVNHLEGHALTVRLTDGLDFPYLLLLVSGGHCQLVEVLDVGRYRRLGTTRDDALGEAYDKVAKMLGLGFPGGPAVEQAARTGDPDRFRLPRPMRGQPGCDFSFSGLKTAVRQQLLRTDPADRGATFAADLCASFQKAAIDSVVDRTASAAHLVRSRHGKAGALVVAGGVASNAYVRQQLEALAANVGMRLVAPPPELCTDNGVMIAWAGIERLTRGLVDPSEVRARARWPLDPDAEPAIGTRTGS